MRKKTIGMAAGLAAVFSLTACATRPLPQDVTGLDTYAIVQKVRCEVRAAVISYAAGVLKRDQRPDLATAIQAQDFEFSTLSRETFSPETQAIFARYDGSEIGYEFTFDITETNSLVAGADFISPLSRGLFSLGISSDVSQERQNTRNFRVIDTFADLLAEFTTAKCEKMRTQNAAYPIVGKLGLDELVSTFLDLNQSGNLRGPAASANVPFITDSIVFTTALSGSVNPVVLLNPAGNGFQFLGAGLTAGASRTDTHTLKIALSLPPEAQPEKVSPRRDGTPAGKKPAGGAQGTPASRTNQQPGVFQELERQDLRVLGLELKTLTQ